MTFYKSLKMQAVCNNITLIHYIYEFNLTNFTQNFRHSIRLSSTTSIICGNWDAKSQDQVAKENIASFFFCNWEVKGDVYVHCM